MRSSYSALLGLEWHYQGNRKRYIYIKQHNRDLHEPWLSRWYLPLVSRDTVDPNSTPLLTVRSHDSIGPAITALPDFLKENNYQDITDMVHTPLQKAWNTDLPAFLWVETKPDNFAHFNQFMVVQHLGMPTWLDVYPYQEKADGLKLEQPFFVDLGGGFGHQSIALREKLPHLPNRIILQDIPTTLAHAIKHPGVEVAVQDFFQPQAIIGNIIHSIIFIFPESLRNNASVKRQC